jgi:hypothetical protein
VQAPDTGRFKAAAREDVSGCVDEMNTPESATAEDYRRAFLALESQSQMTDTRRRLLRIHYRFYHHQATMSQIAEAMGWKTFSSANVHYGRLAQLVGDEMGFQVDGAYSNVLCTFVSPQEPGDHWLNIMRPQVAEALRQLGWA